MPYTEQVCPLCGHCPTPRRSRKGRKVLTPDQVRDIKRRLAAGERGVDIARATGVLTVTISQIKHGVSHRGVV